MSIETIDSGNAMENGSIPHFETFELSDYIRITGSTSHLRITSIVVSFLIIWSACWALVFNLCYPHVFYAFMLFSGFIVGLIGRWTSLYAVETIIGSPQIAHFLFPLLAFCFTLDVDYHTFGRNFFLIMSMSLGYCTVQVIMLTLTIHPMLSLSYSWAVAQTIMFAVTATPIEVGYTVEELGRSQGQLRQLQVLLQGEKLVTMFFTCYALALITKYVIVREALGNKLAAFIFIYSAWLCVGCLAGIVCAILLKYPCQYAYKDVVAQTLIRLCGVLISHYLAEWIGCSGPLSVLSYGVISNARKGKSSPLAEKFLANFWPFLMHALDTIAFTLCGILLGLIPQVSDIFHGGFVVTITLLILFGRAVFYVIISPLITRTGPQLKWRQITVAVLGVYKGSPALLLSVSTYGVFSNAYVSYQVLTYNSIIVLLTMFFNVVLLRNMFSILGMYTLSKSRLVNMNLAVAQVNNCREKGIFSLKLDRVIADSNWLVVENVTRMNHPYKNELRNSDTDHNFDGDIETRILKCTNCGTEKPAPPTKKEFISSVLEAKHRILKAQLVSFWRQCDNGTLSAAGMRLLSNLVESTVVKEDPTINSSDLKIQLEGSQTLRCLKAFFGYLFTITSKTHRFVPTNWFRAFCFRVCTSRSFQIFMASTALVDLFCLMHLLNLYYFQPRTTNTINQAQIVQMCDIFFYTLFTFEFWIQIFGIGAVQYFCSNVNKVEFASSILVRTCQLSIYLDIWTKHDSMPNVFFVDRIVMFLKTLLLLRVTRIYIFVVAVVPKILNLVDRRMDEDLILSYDVGKAYLIGLDRVSKFLSHIVGNESAYLNLKSRIENDRMTVARELGLIQKDRPTIAITTKTRHAVRHVVNSMNECCGDLKDEGILDTNENLALVKALNRVKERLHLMDLVSPCDPDNILRQIPWLHGDVENASFLLEHARLCSYDYKDAVIYAGDDPMGLFILVTGMVQCLYRPTASSIQLNSQFGVLPNCDFLTNMRLDQPQEDYMAAGNIIGEIGIVTSRRYDMTITCETAIQMYYIPWNIVKSVIHSSSNAPVLKARIWKSIGIKIGLILLQHLPQFQGWQRERLLFYLQRGLVPILTGVHSIHLNDLVEDVILIEGAAMDYSTRAIYRAPHYISRTVQKLLLPEHPQWKFPTMHETQVMIIPTSHSDQADIMGPDGIFKDQYYWVHFQAEETAEEESEGKSADCRHEAVAKIKANMKRLIKAQKRKHRKLGFMDYTPQLFGPIEGLPVKTSFLIQENKEKRRIVRTSAHPRVPYDYTINMVHDIEEVSEKGSMKEDPEDEEEELNRKLSARTRTTKRTKSKSGSMEARLSSALYGHTSLMGSEADGSGQRKTEIKIIDTSAVSLDVADHQEVQTALQMGYKEE